MAVDTQGTQHWENPNAYSDGIVRLDPPFSISLWINVQTGATFAARPIVRWENDYGYGFDMFFFRRRFVLTRTENQADPAEEMMQSEEFPLTTGVWVHCLGIVSHNADVGEYEMRYYENGVEQNAASFRHWSEDERIYYDGWTMYVGKGKTLNADVIIKGLAVWNVALNATERALLYASRCIDMPLIIAPDYLRCFYRFDEHNVGDAIGTKESPCYLPSGKSNLAPNGSGGAGVGSPLSHLCEPDVVLLGSTSITVDMAMQQVYTKQFGGLTVEGGILVPARRGAKVMKEDRMFLISKEDRTFLVSKEKRDFDLEAN